MVAADVEFDDDDDGVGEVVVLLDIVVTVDVEVLKGGTKVVAFVVEVFEPVVFVVVVVDALVSVETVNVVEVKFVVVVVPSEVVVEK